MITIYHNPRCSKSRQTLEILQSEKVDLNIILYLETPIDKPTLTSLLAKLNMAPREIIRRSEDEFKENQLGAQEVTDAQLISAMIKYPKLIERPIVVSEERAVIGRPPENVWEIL
jgi:arsenate reductase